MIAIVCISLKGCHRAVVQHYAARIFETQVVGNHFACVRSRTARRWNRSSPIPRVARRAELLPHIAGLCAQRRQRLGIGVI